jgi:polysaccharide deacetylase family protein (PEP-CTERM system associated)
VTAPLFLFSIDLEDVRTMIPGGDRHRPRVPEMTGRYLEFLRTHRARCTFFTVGQTAREYPSLIREIAAEGHELACHTDTHKPLTELDRASFRDDLIRNRDALAVGGTEVVGFRAPTFSLVERTSWAHEVLADLGFRYSSSVIPAKNPLFGWPEFGSAPRAVSGVMEIPVNIRASTPRVPFGGGVYFRVLPRLMIESSFRAAAAANQPVVGYLHPYDIDTEQERFMHPGLDGSRFYNRLMYVGRGGVFARLSRLMNAGWRIEPYRDFVRSLGAAA